MFPNLKGKKILIGVTGGIAAYKIASLISLLKKEDAEIQIIMTKSATEFITPLTLQTLSGNTVYIEMFNQRQEADIHHISLARWADCLLIAPATANIIAKMANGIADDLLSTVCLATKAPICVAPAMNVEMWKNKITQRNISTLRENNMRIFGPNEGVQACKEIGHGRLIEPQELLNHLNLFFKKNSLKGKKIIITAGPTIEGIDPVRFISNRSSGKMGYAIARAAVDFGAEVTLISGPTALEQPFGISRFIKVESADEMYNEVMPLVASSDIFISTAAVSDYRPEKIEKDKIKKSGDCDSMSLTLIQNKDILKTVGALEKPPFTVGFAAETEKLEEYAKNKLTNKNLDMIVANIVGKNIGFDSDTNELILFTKKGETIKLNKNKKTQLAYELLEIIIQVIQNKPQTPVQTPTEKTTKTLLFKPN